MRLKHHKYCMVEECGEIAHIRTSISTYDVAQDLVEVQDRPTESDKSSPLAQSAVDTISNCIEHFDFHYHVQDIHHSHSMVEITPGGGQIQSKSLHICRRQ